MNSLLGIWLFTSLIYNGEVRPLPNKDLMLYYIFNSTTQNEIYYYRQNESGFCRRLAEYTNDDAYIEQKITFVDPENNSECSLDPDMQLGTFSKVPYVLNSDQLHMSMSMGDDELVYVFTKTNPE